MKSSALRPRALLLALLALLAASSAFKPTEPFAPGRVVKLTLDTFDEEARRLYARPSLFPRSRLSLRSWLGGRTWYTWARSGAGTARS